MLKALKIKVKSLATEARIIRHEENKNKAFLGVLRQKESFKHGLEEPRPEARKEWPTFENKDELLEKVFADCIAMRHHRVHKLRKVARINHLAYGFLRGVPYGEMEEDSHTIPDFEEIEKTAARFSEVGDNVFRAQWEEWMEAARVHIES